MEILFSAGLDVAVTLRDGRTPLHAAVERNCPSLVRRLIEWKADVSMEAVGMTPLSAAGLSQGIERKRCEIPIYGQQWICWTCYRQLCEGCHTYEGAPYPDLKDRL